MVLLHELLRGVCRNVEDIPDMRIEIPRRHFGFERSQQSTKFHRFVEGACVLLGPQYVDAFLDLWDRGHVFPLRNDLDTRHVILGPPYAYGPRWASDL